MGDAAKDLMGQQFVRLLVMRRAGSSQGRATWRCRCDCGTETIVRGKDLRSGNTRSCGCLSREVTAATGASTRRHGHKTPGGASPTYNSWIAMRRRCADPADKDFAEYGGRGIVVCARWEKFEYFLADMGERPKGKTLDRYPNNNGHYEPGNCRWATPEEQASNRRDSHLLSIGGESLTLTEWARRSGLSRACLWHRVKRGLSGSKLLTPSRKGRSDG